MNKLKSFMSFLKEETAKKYGVVFIMLLVFSLLCELFIFNYKWLNSIGSKEIKAEITSSSGVNTDNGKLTFNKDSASITLRNVDSEVKYIGFKLNDNSDNTGVLKITISAKDEANASNALTAPERTIVTSVPASQYIPLHFSGKIDEMRISVTKSSVGSVSCDGIILNARVPLSVSIPRILILALILTALYALRPKSSVYGIVTDLNGKNHQRIAAALVIIIMSVIFGGMVKWNTGVTTWHETYEHHQMYYELTDAFKSGHFYLEAEPSEALKNMDNPYDFAGRYAANADFKWDHAYYEGKYYVYFGAAPALLMYLPYNLITGENLPNYIAVYILGVLLIIGVMFLLWEIIKKWFKKTPFALYILMSVVFTAPALTYAAYKPDFYLVPVLMALALSLFGIALWLSSETVTKKGKERLVSWKLCVGSLCIALTAGCRPQFLIAAVFGVMLLWNRAFRTRELFSKRGMRATIAVCAPFVIVGALVMFYNAARFGSPFDFGANYNLTTNDMTHRGFVWGRTGLGIFTYLFQPFRIDALFPFLHDFEKATSYQGLTLTENLMGGALWLYPVLLIGIYGLTKKDIFPDKRSYRMVYFGMIMTVIITIADTQMAGLLTRYYNDFVWLLMIGSVITVFALYERSDGDIKASASVINITVCLSFITLAFSFLSVFAHTEDAVVSTNPDLYYSIQYMIAFWM